MPTIEVIPDFRQLIIQILSLLFLYLMFKRHGWEPAKAFLAKRQALVLEQFEEAEVAKNQAHDLKEKYEKQMMDVEEESERLIEASKNEGKQVYHDMLSEARKEVEQKQAKADATIEQERKMAHDKIKEELVDLTISGVEQIIKKEMDAKVHQQLFDDFVAKVGGAHDAK